MTSYRKQSGIWLAWFCAAVFAQSSLRIVKGVQNQLPPVARPATPWNFSLMPNTFAANSAITLSVQGLPSWATFDAASSTFSGVPTSADLGASTVNIIAQAGSKQTTSPFSLLVADVPLPFVGLPVATQLPNASSLPPGCILHYDQSLRVPSNWSFSIGFQQYTFTDSQQDPIYYNAYLSNSTSLPYWLKFNNETVTFNGNAPQSGLFPITIYGSNVFGYGDVQQTFVITVSEHGFDLATPLPALVASSTSQVNYTIPVSLFTIDNEVALPQNISSIAVDLSAYPELSYDTTTFSIVGQIETGPADITITAVDSYGQNLTTSIPVQIQSPAFTQDPLPPIVVAAGHRVSENLSRYFKLPTSSYSATFEPQAASDWLSYEPQSGVLSGQVPASETQTANVTVSILNTPTATTALTLADNLGQTATLIIMLNQRSSLQQAVVLSDKAKIVLITCLSALGGILLLVLAYFCIKRTCHRRDLGTIELRRSQASSIDAANTPKTWNSVKKEDIVLVREVPEQAKRSTPGMRFVSTASADAQPAAFMSVFGAQSNGLGISSPQEHTNFSTYKPGSNRDSFASESESSKRSSWDSKASSRLFYTDDSNSSHSVPQTTPKQRRDFKKIPPAVDVAAANNINRRDSLSSQLTAGSQPGSARIQQAYIARPSPTMSRGLPSPLDRPRLVPFTPTRPYMGSPQLYGVASPHLDSSPLLSSSSPAVEDAVERNRWSVASAPYSVQRPPSEVVQYLRNQG